MARPNALTANDDTPEKDKATPAPTAPSTTGDGPRKDKDDTKDNRKGGYGTG